MGAAPDVEEMETPRARAMASARRIRSWEMDLRRSVSLLSLFLPGEMGEEGETGPGSSGIMF